MSTNNYSIKEIKIIKQALLEDLIKYLTSFSKNEKLGVCLSSEITLNTINKDELNEIYNDFIAETMKKLNS